MEPRIIAVFVDVFLWIISVIFCVFILLHFFRNQGEVKKNFLQENKTAALLIFIIISALIPVISGIVFKVANIYEAKGIIWGCYMEWVGFFIIILFMLQSAVFIVLTILAVSFHEKLKFRNRIYPVYLFFLLQFYSLIMFKAIDWGVYLFAGDLYGKNLSCW